jgi:hypothetical protein
VGRGIDRDRARRWVGPLAVALLALTAAQAAVAGEDMIADRPGLGESASAVGRLRVQVETGLAWARLDTDTRGLDLPQGLVRVGLGGSLELRWAAPDWLRSTRPGSTESGWTDTSLGLKWHLAAGGNDLSLRGTVYLPTGSTAWSDENVDPEGSIAWSRDLSAGWSAGATVAARRFGTSVPSVLSPSLSIGRTLGSRTAAFVEYGAILGKSFRPVHLLDFGCTWLPNANTQLDVSAGFGLSAAATHLFVGLGLSRRF